MSEDKVSMYATDAAKIRQVKLAIKFMFWLVSQISINNSSIP